MIVVTTPTGNIGHQVLENVLDGGEPIRVIARDPARLPAQARERVEVVQRSMGNLDVVSNAFDGADAVFWLVPPCSNAETIVSYILNFTRPLCEAVTSRRVKQVVAVSSLGRGVARKAGLVSAALAMDALIESTGVNYRSLCPPAFMENLLRQIEPITTHGTFFSPVSGDRKLPTCATRDVAASAARLLLDDSWSGQDSVALLGPEDLSYNDMAHIMSEVLQRPIRFQQVSGAEYKATLMQHGASQAWAQGIVDMLTQIDQGIYNTEPRTPQSTTPTTFAQWCDEVLKPAIWPEQG